MIETEPKYFTEFRKELTREFGELKGEIKEINGKLDAHSDEFKLINKEIEQINDKLDYHFETIGEIKVEVTKTNILLNKKTNDKETQNLEKRVEKLENAVFA
jgi:predicted nuclease with TOPRIM domain